MKRKKKMARKATEVSVEDEREMSMEELGAKEVEIADKNANIDDEAFANEMLTVRVATSSVDSAPIFTAVNGTSQYFLRGKKQKVKRKYVEALARAKTYVYEQVLNDPRDPGSLRMVERRTSSYPFEILHDPNPKGQAWIERILAE